MVVKMATSNGGSLAVLAGSEAGNGSTSAGAGVDGTDAVAEACSGGRIQDDITADHTDDEHGGDVGSEDSDSMDFDDDDDDDGSDLMSNTTLGDDITAQLAAAGPVGMAAAAAINSSKKRKRPHSFETNPSIRRRQQTRLLRKLRQTIDEYATRVGQQAIVLIATPGKPQNNFRVFGAKPLEDVVKNVKATVLQDLETALAHHAPPPAQDDPSLYELPPLVIDGIPTPVEKMTQAQLRAFIPLMLKFSTGRGKPGWGKESTRPPWWPGEVPWANVRMDARPEDDKQRVSWTHALRQIVINCYKYHGREDLLPAFSEDATEETSRPAKVIKTETETEQQQADRTAEVQPPQQQQQQQQQQQPSSQPAQLQQQQQNVQQLVQSTPASTAQYAPTVVQTISNPDGTVSIIQVDPNNPIITLPDGTTAQVVATQGVATVNQCDDDDGNGGGHDQQQQQSDRNHHLINPKPMIWQFVPTSQITGVTNSDGVTTLTNSADGTTVTTVDLSAVTESTIGQDGQHHILLTGEDGQTYPVSVSGMITVPAMYQAVVANISQMGQSDASVQVLGPLISSLPKSDSNGGDDGAMVSTTSAAAAAAGTAAGGMNVGGLSVTPVLALGPNGTQQHILQVFDVNQSRTTMWLTGDGQKVTAAPMVTSQLLGEVDSSILASAMQQVTSGDVDLQETSPSSNSE